MEDLKYWRGVLDGLDNTLVRILVQRENISKVIGEIKRMEKLDVHQSSRERRIVERLALFYSSSGGSHHDPLSYIARIYTPVFERSKEIQNGIPYQDCSETQL